jgi:hypothetical protein
LSQGLTAWAGFQPTILLPPPPLCPTTRTERLYLQVESGILLGNTYQGCLLVHNVPVLTMQESKETPETK